MAFLNLGKKDAHGHQKRIEHRGRNLRASRTGGVALRASTKAAGLNLTGNTSHGLRVSTSVANNTHVAMQNGRFVLRGRYGKGPTKLNLSKTGLSVSTHNEIGTFNWLKPNFSSVKIAGVQMRGRKAANIQAVFLVFSAAFQLLKLAVVLVGVLLRVMVFIAVQSYHLIRAAPYYVSAAQRRWRNWRLGRQAEKARALFKPPLTEWHQGDLRAALALIFSGYGRGQTASEAASEVARTIKENPGQWPELDPGASELESIANRLERARNQGDSKAMADPRVVLVLIAERMASVMTDDQPAQGILDADEIASDLGTRTRLQEDMLQVFADFAGLRFRVSSEAGTETDPSHASVSKANHAEPSPAGVNLNQASLEQLQNLPHIGPERARAIISLRPITDFSQLGDVDGIGPSRLDAINAAGVAL